MITLEGQVVVVTGAGRGLGAASARLLGARGATVVVHDAGAAPDGSGGDPALAAAVATDVVAAGGTAEAENQDLATRAGCEALVAAVLGRHGRVDALVHGAGLVRHGGVAATGGDAWAAMLAVDVEAPWWLCRAVWPGMVDRSYGRIVLTVPGYGPQTSPGPDVTAYGVGRAAQLGLVNGLAGEGAACGVRVNAVSPDELGPDDAAPAVVALVSRECPVTGTVLAGSGGTWSPAVFPVRPAPGTPEAVLALLSSPSTPTPQTPQAPQTPADDDALETERHLFWRRLQGEHGDPG